MILRSISLFCALIIAFTTLCACAPQNSNEDVSKEPEVTSSPEVTTTEATTTEATTTEATTTEVTTTEATTTEATTTEATTTEATTTEATTTEATTTEEIPTEEEPSDLGILGYDLSKKISTDASLANGDVKDLVINEICSSNKATIKDMDGDYVDWVEIYNPTDKIINLEGVGLSDDAKDAKKWTFPSVNIQPHSYIIVFASDKNVKTPELHTGFKISGGNEEIILSTPDSVLIDKIIVSDSAEDITYGRYPDGSDKLMLMSATPGESNDKAENTQKADVVKPVLSHESGFYSNQFSLKLTAEDGCTIYYTTDGSVPTTSSTKYTGAITIKDRSPEKAVYIYKKGITVDSNIEYPYKEFEKATVIRAISVDKNGNVSDVTTATYFVSSSIAEKYKNVDVISVVIDPEDLYDQEKGIYVAGNVFKEWRKENPHEELDGSTPANFNQRGSEWERDAHITYFRAGELEFSYDVGTRIHGGWSRNRKQKSFRFYFREEYGQKKLDYKLFENNTSEDDGKVIKSYKRFLIRNGGNDEFTLTFKDPWTQSLFGGFDFGTQADNLVICFLDGEYWGLYTACETIDRFYVENNYGIPDEDVILVKNGELEEGDPETESEVWEDVVRFIRDNDMSDPENYKKACEMVDMDSFCQYIAAELYIANEDWLWNNAAWWRSRSTDKKDSPYQDGKWRFVMFDVEYAMNLYGNGDNYKDNILDDLLNGDGRFSGMIVSLLENNDFKTKFVLACEDVMNIAFDPNYAGAKLMDYYDWYEPYIDQHMDRYVSWQSLKGVQNNVRGFTNWLKNRRNSFLGIIKEDLGISASNGSVKISINNSVGGTVEVNGHPVHFKNKTWSGTYMTGYKIRIEAVPAKGYKFVGWKGSYEGTESAIAVGPGKQLELEAVFEKE